MVKFYCENCGYGFSPKNHSKINPPKTCPYCNRKDTVSTERTAQELINEFAD